MALWDEPNIELECQSVRSQYSVWPLTASITMDVKNNHAHVTTQKLSVDVCFDREAVCFNPDGQ